MSLTLSMMTEKAKPIVRFYAKRLFVGWQRSVYRELNKHRFIVIAAGRQSGKTLFCVMVSIIHALKHANSTVWWVAPIYDQSRIGMRRIIKFLAKYKIPHNVNKTELSVSFQNGSTIWFKSGDKEDSLRGETVDFMVIDEMGLMKRDVWEYSLRGTITVTRARVMFIGTAKGKNLFYELWVKGQDREQAEYISYQFESRDNPYFSAEEWDHVKLLPQRVFEQEYLSKFIDDGGAVFRGVRDCIKGDLDTRRHSAKSYYAGIDLAKSHDYTVVYILDNDGHMVFQDRFNDISWGVQKERIIKSVKHYDAYCLMDSTGLGDPILDDLMPYIRVDGYKFSNTSKRQLIEFLAMAIERQEISFPEIPELINELSIYTFEQTESGLIKYNAPDGMHDDCVIALALAAWACLRGRGSVDSFDMSGSREEYDF